MPIRCIIGIMFAVLLCTAMASFLCAGEPATTPPVRTINQKDGAEMVLIPAGEFLMGTSAADMAAWQQAHPGEAITGFADETPQRRVSLDAFFLYKTEVTLAQYRKFCEETKRALPTRSPWKWQDTLPVVNVSWDDAKAYADWAGAALPTEAQWEKAARGGDARVYPWGNDWPPPKGAGNFADITARAQEPSTLMIPGIIGGYDDGCVNPAPVGFAAENPYGVRDLAGNVWEWCADWYGVNYYQNAPARNPTGPATGTVRVMRGGSWASYGERYLRAAYRGIREPTGKGIGLGFRCAVAAPVR